MQGLPVFLQFVRQSLVLLVVVDLVSPENSERLLRTIQTESVKLFTQTRTKYLILRVVHFSLYAQPLDFAYRVHDKLEPFQTGYYQLYVRSVPFDFILQVFHSLDCCRQKNISHDLFPLTCVLIDRIQKWFQVYPEIPLFYHS